MVKDDRDFCRQRIAEQTRLALAAPCPEVAEKYLQLAALYRVQLAGLMHGEPLDDQGPSYAAAS
ncbi:MAG: hypothetical protein JWQ16_1610 [Novosphingobium sp.]|nr:hypothetical protein [Novosphingobium sp.]